MSRRLTPIAAVIGGLMLAVPALASHVQPQFVGGASSCGPLEPGTVELVVEVPQDLLGTIGDDDFSADVTLEGSVGNGSVTFQNATLPVKAVFVAGIDGGNLYSYEEPVTEDDGLVAPDGQPISGVSFCYVTEAEAGSSPSVAASEAPSAAPSAAASPSGDVAGASDSGGGATPPATDTEPEPASPSGSIVLVAAGLALLSIGLVLGLPRRRAVPRR